MKSKLLYMPHIPTSKLILTNGEVVKYNGTYMVHKPVFKNKGKVK